MRISQLASTYDLDKRSIDYYTTLGLIPCTTLDGSKYREYGEDAETVVKKIVILRDAGLSEKDIKKALSNPSYFTTAKWNEHIQDMKDRITKIETMITYAEELRDTHSYALRYASVLQKPEESHIVSQVMKHVIDKLKPIMFSSDEVNNQYQDADGDISDVLEAWAMCLMRVEKLYHHNSTYDSSDVQRTIAKCIRKITGLYCVIMAFVYDCLKDFDGAKFGLEGEDLEIYNVIMKLLAVIAAWFKIAKSIDNALDFNRFQECCKDQITALDQEFEDSSFDTLTSLITDICNLPKEIPTEYLANMFGGPEEAQASFKIGYEMAMEEKDRDVDQNDMVISENESQGLIDPGFAAFFVNAFQYYITTQRQPIESSFIPVDAIEENN